MKTPRDWLFDRHQEATPNLHALRRTALPSGRSGPELWRALFLPHRTAWRLLAATWAILLLFHFTLGRPPRSAPFSSPPPAVLAALTAQFDRHDAFAQNYRLP